jgi:hypothetical protein
MEFWKSTFSKEGCQSWGRVAASYLLVLGSAWITRLIMLVVGPEQFDKLGAIGVFLGVLIGSVSTLYGISKGLDTYQKVKGVTEEACPTDKKEPEVKQG